MSSFNFLQPYNSSLCSIAQEAEELCAKYPTPCVVQCRKAAEGIVKILCTHFDQEYDDTSLMRSVKNLHKVGNIPESQMSDFRELINIGNKGAHFDEFGKYRTKDTITSEDALTCLKTLWRVSLWYASAVHDLSLQKNYYQFLPPKDIPQKTSTNIYTAKSDRGKIGLQLNELIDNGIQLRQNKHFKELKFNIQYLQHQIAEKDKEIENEKNKVKQTEKQREISSYESETLRKNLTKSLEDKEEELKKTKKELAQLKKSEAAYKSSAFLFDKVDAQIFRSCTSAELRLEQEREDLRNFCSEREIIAVGLDDIHTYPEAAFYSRVLELTDLHSAILIRPSCKGTLTYPPMAILSSDRYAVFFVNTQEIPALNEEEDTNKIEKRIINIASNIREELGEIIKPQTANNKSIQSIKIVIIDYLHANSKAIPAKNEIFLLGLLNIDMLDDSVLELMAWLDQTKASKKGQAEDVLSLFTAPVMTAGVSQSRIKAQPGSAGERIDKLALESKQLTIEQQELARLNIGEHPRLIRGVAGSGKTIVLAYQVATLIHRSQHCQASLFGDSKLSAKVAVICYNRALIPLLTRDIAKAFSKISSDPLPHGFLYVGHMNNIYYNLSRMGLCPYRRVGEEKSSKILNATYYLNALIEFKSKYPNDYQKFLYDYIFIDEAQDLHPQDIEFLHNLTRPSSRTGERPLSIFYDDAQNIYGRTRPNWSSLGIDVKKGDRAKIMKQCLRSTKEVVELAFNILIGSKSDLKQDQNRTFADYSFLIKNKMITEKERHIMINFAPRSNPDVLPVIKIFEKREDELDWIANHITRLTTDHCVSPEHILILYKQELPVAQLQERIIKISELQKKPIKIKGLANIQEEKEQYMPRDGFINISTIYSAKGYDCQIVILAGCDTFDVNPEDRACFYVGATRAKTMLYLSGLRNSKILSEAKETLQCMMLPSKDNKSTNESIFHTTKSCSHYSEPYQSIPTNKIKTTSPHQVQNVKIRTKKTKSKSDNFLTSANEIFPKDLAPDIKEKLKKMTLAIADSKSEIK